jgi:acetyl-CoA synthetase
LIKYGDEWVRKYDRSSLQCLGSVGEPINNEAWNWFYEVVGEKRCKIADTWWQTETGAHCISPLPCSKDDEILPTMAMRAFFGIDAVLLNEKGEELSRGNSEGILCIKQTWPSMARTIYNDHKRYLDTYFKPFPGYFFTGDGSLTDAKGNFQITGRVDDVINVSGHRIGTAEIEDAIDEHGDICESAVVSFPHDLYGEGIFAYVTIKENVKLSQTELIIQLKALVKSKIAHYAIPHRILFTSNLPKTRSGKIMRRILRKIASDKPDELGDISTLADSSVVEEILRAYEDLKKNEQSISI